MLFRSPNGFVPVLCPWHDGHSTGDDGTGYSPLGAGGGRWKSARGFKCLHGSCTEKKRDTKAFLEWVDAQGGPKASKYDPVPALQPDPVFVESEDRKGGAGGLTLAGLRERGADAFSDLSGRIEQALKKAPDPENTIVSCRIEGRTAFARKFDCQSRGGRVLPR